MAITDSSRDDDLLRRAIARARRSVAEGGGPFGALIARGGAILAEGANRVTLDRDPTAHAEVVAIRGACARLEDFRLQGCTLYASCEPCPMCLAAAHWARVERVVFACTREDAAAAGFDDALLHAELARPMHARRLPSVQRLAAEGLCAFQDWRALENRSTY